MGQRVWAGSWVRHRLGFRLKFRWVWFQVWARLEFGFGSGGFDSGSVQVRWVEVGFGFEVRGLKGGSQWGLVQAIIIRNQVSQILICTSDFDVLYIDGKPSTCRS